MHRAQEIGYRSRVVDVATELKEYGCMADVCDPWAESDEAKHE